MSDLEILKPELPPNMNPVPVPIQPRRNCQLPPVRHPPPFQPQPIPAPPNPRAEETLIKQLRMLIQPAISDVPSNQLSGLSNPPPYPSNHPTLPSNQYVMPSNQPLPPSIQPQYHLMEVAGSYDHEETVDIEEGSQVLVYKPPNTIRM